MQYKVSKTAVGQRLDVFATAKIGKTSRAFIEKLCDQGKVTVNGKLEKNSYKVRAGDKIVVDFDFGMIEHPPVIDLPILYEDDDCLVINKPSGVLTHSKGAFNPEATVATFIAPKLSGLDGERAGIVHRLDRATSGVIICAKNTEALAWLQKQFSQRKVKKTYYAVIDGQPEPPEAIIDVAIERHPHNPKTFRAGAAGRTAITHYQVVKQGNGHSLLKLEPQTGRTHQLRVHLKYIGHSIIGDTVYGGSAADRLMLHAESLELTLPNHQRQTFVAPLPPEFRAILKG